MKIRLATRGSKLALAQADIVKNLLQSGGHEVDTVLVSTKGDKDKTSPVAKIGGRGLFVKEIEKTLLDDKADIAVHSGKDLPYDLEAGLVIGATPKAADPRDLLIVRKNIINHSQIKIIGTGSARRITECKNFFPDAKFLNIRGNVDTRLKKLKNGEYDAIILAKAGLDRLNADLSDFDVISFSPDEFIPSACQGIIAVECKGDNDKVLSALKCVNDSDTKRRFDAERYMFSLLKADCTVPLGVHCEINNDEYKISAMLNDKKICKKGKDYKELCLKIKSELLH